MKRNIGEIITALLFGICSCYLFYSIYGIVAYFDVEYSLIAWTDSVPRSIRSSAYYLHFFIEEILVAFFVVAFFGTFLGVIIRGNPVRYGLISFAGAIGAYFYMSYNYSQIWDNTFNLPHVNYPLWYSISILLVWLLLFFAMPKFGLFLKRRRSKG